MKEIDTRKLFDLLLHNLEVRSFGRALREHENVHCNGQRD